MEKSSINTFMKDVRNDSSNNDINYNVNETNVILKDKS